MASQLTTGAFCETDLRLKQLVQKAKFAAYVLKAELHQRIVLVFESLVGLPVHAFGLATITIQDASLPAQAFAQLVSSGGCPVASAFFLRGIAKSATLTAGEVPARRVEHSYPLAATWTSEPVSFPAQVAG